MIKSAQVVTLALGASLSLAANSALAQAPAADPIQQQFVVAMQALQAGRADEAVTILSVLALQTDAPRIRLELARALYFQGRWKEARAEFDKVYRRPDLPYAVRRTVNTFLADIDQRAGYFQPTLSLAVDSNPLQTPSSGVYDIFGIPLEYESTAKTETGLRLQASGAAPIGRTGYSLVGLGEITRFRSDDLGHLSANLAVRRPDAGRRGWWSVGATWFERRKQNPSATVYLERVRRITLPDQSRQVVVRGAVSRIAVRDRPQYDGWGVDGGADYGFDLSPNVAVNLSAGAGWAGARYEVDRRAYGTLGANLTAAMPRWNKTVTVQASAGDTRFGDVDPFFGKVRDDRTYGLEARLLDGRPIHGLFPSVSLSWEKRDSSIGFFGYERTGFNLGLQRRF